MRFGRDPSFRGDRLAPGAREPGTGRARDLLFADTFMEELAKKKDVRSAILAAGKRLDWHWGGQHKEGWWRREMTDRQMLRKGRKILEREGVVEHMKFHYEAQGFSVIDATKKVIEHITTPTDKHPLGNPDMLKLYFSQTTEEQTKKIQIDSRTLVAHKMISEEPPRMRARVLKTAPEALPS